MGFVPRWRTTSSPSEEKCYGIGVKTIQNTMNFWCCCKLPTFYSNCIYFASVKNPITTEFDFSLGWTVKTTCNSSTKLESGSDHFGKNTRNLKLLAWIWNFLTLGEDFDTLGLELVTSHLSCGLLEFSLYSCSNQN